MNKRKALPVHKLKEKLQKFKISTIEIKWIKFLNYLNFSQDSFLKFYNKYFSPNSKFEIEFLSILTSDPINFLKKEANSIEVKHDRMNLYSIFIFYLSRYIFTNEIILTYINSDEVLFSLNFIFSKFYTNHPNTKEYEDNIYIITNIERNFLEILFSFLNRLNKNFDFFGCFLPHIKEKVSSFLAQVNKHLSIEFLCEDKNFIELRLDLLDILIEISFLNSEIREYSKSFYQELRSLENSIKILKKKSNIKKLDKDEKKIIDKEIFIQSVRLNALNKSNVEVMHKDNEIMIYKFIYAEDVYVKIRKESSHWIKLKLEKETDEDFVAILKYLNETVFLLKLRNDLIEYFKNITLNRKFKINSESLNQLEFLEEFDSIYNREDIISFFDKPKRKLNNTSETLEILFFKKNIILMERFISEDLRKINCCWSRVNTSQKFKEFLLSEEFNRDKMLKFIFDFMKAVQFPLNINKGIRDYCKNGKEEDDEFILNKKIYITNDRQENKLNFQFKNKLLKEFFNTKTKQLEDSIMNLKDLNVFLNFFLIVLNNQVKSLVKRNERRNKIKDILNKETNYDDNQIEDETNDYSVSYISENRKKRIIDDEEDEELSFLN